MSLVTFDSHSLMIDGRRIWLVSGSMPYARIPRSHWAARIDAARRAGLNCLCIDAPWFLHEPSPGAFDFEEEADIAAFIGLIAEHGMMCIVRPGPHLGGGWDGGGLPAWLTADPTVTPRSTHRQHRRFLEATGRYFGALMDQVRDLQATSPEGGPIVIMQAEREWFCDPPEHHAGYPEELLRLLREHGCEVPVTMANNMWTRVDGTIDTWNAHEHLATDLRQFPVVQPNAPRIVSEFACAPPQPVTGAAPPMAPSECLRKLAEILSAGAQYNVHLFHGGTAFGFQGGTSPAGEIYGATPAPAAPLAEDGQAGPLLPAVKSISTFASQFAHVLAHLDHGPFHVAVAPYGDDHVPSVIHQRGTQGDLVFIIRPASDRRRTTDLMLANGLTLPVPLGDDPVAWVVLNANLGSIELDYTSLRPWAWIAQRLLVLFGPAGMTGHLSVNEAPMTLSVPEGRRPLVEQHETTTIVVLNHLQMAAATIEPDGLFIGVDGHDDDGHPIPHAQWKTGSRIELDGSVHALHFKRGRSVAAARLTGWEHALPGTCLEDAPTAFTPLEGPTTLEDAGAAAGYGWYALEFAKPWTGRTLPGEWGDRVHLYRDGRLETLWGRGPGATADPFTFKAAGRIVVLVEQSGRRDGGPVRAEPAGLADHLYAVKPVRLGRAVTPTTPPPDPFELGGYVPGLRAGDLPDAGSYAWRIAASGSLPLIVEIGCLPQRCLLTVNGAALGLCLPGIPGGRFVLRSGQHLRRRPNELRLAFFDEKPLAGAVTAAVKVHQASRNLTGSATWSFAPWRVPDENAFGPMPNRHGGSARWYRCRFTVTDRAAPLWLDVSSMSKGQVFLNGRHLCRYFAQTATRRRIGESRRCHLPPSWLSKEGTNVLMLFDEHGFKPTDCRLHRHER